MKWLQSIIEDPKRFTMAKNVFYAVVIAIALLEVLTVNILHIGHGYFWFDSLPAFGSFYGLISSLLIIVMAKFVLPRLLSKKEDYYE